MRQFIARYVPVIFLVLVVFAVGIYIGATFIGNGTIKVRRNLACDHGKSILAIPVGNDGVAVVLSNGQTFGLLKTPRSNGRYINYDYYNNPEFLWTGLYSSFIESSSTTYANCVQTIGK